MVPRKSLAACAMFSRSTGSFGLALDDVVRYLPSKGSGSFNENLVKEWYREADVALVYNRGDDWRESMAKPPTVNTGI